MGAATKALVVGKGLTCVLSLITSKRKQEIDNEDVRRRQQQQHQSRQSVRPG
jgi:hypothetical protein